VTVPWPHGDPRDVAHRILSDLRYQSAPQRPGDKPWWELIWDALKELWRRLTEPLDHLMGNNAFTTFVGIVVLIAVAALLVVVVTRYGGRLAARRSARTRAEMSAVGADADARALFARALAAVAEGRHHEAAALLWMSSLRALDERGRVRFDPARTPGEWRRAVRDPDFDALARDAVVALFGDRGADAALVERMREAYARVVAPA
jgi:hypothetical protein